MEFDRSKFKITKSKAALQRFTSRWEHAYLLPQDENEFRESEWGEWLSRIESGFQVEKQRLEEQMERLDKSNGYDFDCIPEDYTKAKDISNNMYAALIVSVWSRVESFLKDIINVCNAHGFNNIGKNFNRDLAISYFKNNLRIDIKGIGFWDEADIVRTLNNSFKHANNRFDIEMYDSEGKKLFLKRMASEYKIPIIEDGELVEYTEIDYSKIKIKELIINVSIFCFKLKEEVFEKLKKISPAIKKNAHDEACEIVSAYQIIIHSEKISYKGKGLELPMVICEGNTPEECYEKTKAAMISNVENMLLIGKTPPSPTTNRKRDESIKVKITNEEKIILKKIADSQGFSNISDLIRTTTLKINHC